MIAGSLIVIQCTRMALWFEGDARGRGGVSDDLYAIGVCVIFLLLGRNPLHAMSTTEVVERKIAMSSYSALTGGARIQMNMVELLRGLLILDVHHPLRTLDKHTTLRQI